MLVINILQLFYLHELVNQFSISMYIFLIMPEPVLTLYYIVLPVFVQKFCFLDFVYQLKPYTLGINICVKLDFCVKILFIDVCSTVHRCV